MKGLVDRVDQERRATSTSLDWTKLLLGEWRAALPIRYCRACLQREVWDTPGDVERMELHEIEVEVLEHDKSAVEAE